ncbi:hypothetical protein LEMA_P087130.1 [Plenodomus lingam JN3]|uniref:Rhodopsin domain-containing protein n=1 Tax=Leptosphaeria maculans (strain JN3 / isolate v23.1.3 / race Av1-4-5-6-7-8) TaxID=985895 RepID=E5A779_LEPMJ|nr:hypothetical protein LEMA_P087130.1 [Plenodomus lingam JN3]CBX99474.1 hypothetical protein LEMA_P087130.1 [Plenodomus lingam JN3]
MATHSSTELSQSGKTQERITIAFLVLAWFFILLRIWTRTIVISNFGWVYCAATLYIEANGGGTHITDVSHLQLLTKWVVVSEALYVMAMMTLKISLGIFFARIVIKPWHFMLIYITVGVNIISSTASFFYVLFRCGTELNNYVLRQIQDKCTAQPLDLFMAYQSASFITLTDLIFLVLPLIILWNANMDRKSKISIGFILCLAALGCICSIIRFRYVRGLTEIDGFFWNAVNISIWSTIEAGASLVAGCLATLRPFLKCSIKLVRERISIGKSITKAVSKSVRSESSTNQSSKATSTPKLKTIISSPKREEERDNRNRSGTMDTDDPEFMDFLALPGDEIIPLEDLPGRERRSTELILNKGDNERDMEFSWPLGPDAVGEEPKERRRKTARASWSMIRGSSRAAEEPRSEPLSAGARDDKVDEV